MLNTREYSSKLPKIVSNAMRNFTNEECVLVKKRQKGKTSNNEKRNCHLNVSYWVNKIGGEIQNGWLLNRNRNLIKKGVWVWYYHSVWKTPEHKLADVTEISDYATNHFTTVWLDNSRSVDLNKGIGYNNIIVFDNQKIVDLWNQHYEQNFEVGKLYWVSDCLRYFKNIEDHSGQYMWLREEYAENIKKLKIEMEKYKDLKEVPIDLIFDYSLSIN